MDRRRQAHWRRRRGRRRLDLLLPLGQCLFELQAAHQYPSGSAKLRKARTSAAVNVATDQEAEAVAEDRARCRCGPKTCATEVTEGVVAREE